MDERRLTRSTRMVLLAYAGLGVAAGVPLYLGTARTDDWFAWTIKPPLTAAALGAAYWATCVVYGLASRERAWARVRVALPAGFVFTTLMLVATLMHLGRFHLHSSSDVARAVAWIWLAAYVAVPALTLVVIAVQWPAPGADPPPTAPLSAGLRLWLAGQAAVMLVLGIALFAAPQATADEIWPWALTPLTARAIGSWLVGIGVIAAHAVWENDLARVRLALVGYMLLAVLEGIALVRYPSTLDWGGLRAWLYAAFLVSVFSVGLAGTVRASGLKAGPARQGPLYSS